MPTLLTQLSTINCQLSTINCQLSTINCQLSTVNCQLSTINCQLSTINYQLSTMKWVYLAAGIALFFKMLIMPNPAAEWEEFSIVESIVADSGVPNAVSGIIFRNRLYDTIFEVVVFTIAVLGVKFLLANEKPTETIYPVSASESRSLRDRPSIVLARLGATIAALVSIELAIRGHLSPGGGFAAGVAGGTAIGLIAITSSSQLMEKIYKKWSAATWEKISVLIFIVLAVFTLIGWEFPPGELGTLVSGGVIPILNVLVAVKVALGSWAAILLFIRYGGLL